VEISDMAGPSFTNDPRPIDSAVVPVRFHYTFDDFCEANLAVQRRQERLQREQSLGGAKTTADGRPTKRSPVMLLVVMLPMVVVLLISNSAHLPRFLQPRPHENLTMRLVGPVVLYFMILFLTIRLAHRIQYGGKRLAPTPVERRGWLTSMAGWGFAACVVAVAVYTRGGMEGKGELLLHEAAMLTIPWLVIFLFQYVIYLLPMKRAGGLIRAQWESTNALHMEKTIAVDDAAFHLSDAHSRYELRWDGIEAVEETDSVFVLIVGLVFYMLPKRVLAPEQMAFVRHVANAPKAVPTGGFPVLPPKR
jgi:hypothetical protein